MRNRIRHLLDNWHPEVPRSLPDEGGDPGAAEESADITGPAIGGHAMPRGINMLMPVELCINRDLLVSLLSASIREIQRHRSALPEGHTSRELAEVEAALQQQLTFRTWARRHPATYISIAMYPVAETDTVEDLEDLGEF
jgi:hypothetical protein